MKTGILSCKPIKLSISDKTVVASRWDGEFVEPDVSYLRIANDGTTKPYMSLPHIPESEYETTVTFTFRGKDALEIRQVMEESAQ